MLLLDIESRLCCFHNNYANIFLIGSVCAKDTFLRSRKWIVDNNQIDNRVTFFGSAKFNDANHAKAMAGHISHFDIFEFPYSIDLHTKITGHILFSLFLVRGCAWSSLYFLLDQVIDEQFLSVECCTFGNSHVRLEQLAGYAEFFLQTRQHLGHLCGTTNQEDMIEVTDTVLSGLVHDILRKGDGSIKQRCRQLVKRFACEGYADWLSSMG